jgi:pimeloyl-[acyl-carrier protein] methyl ester esterase
MLYHKTYGSGNSLYLLHGWALNSRVWDPVVEKLKQHWRTVAIDLPGHGKSSPPESGEYNIDTLTDEVVQTMNEPGIAVGWSLGGMVAINIACRYPHLVRKLVLVASSPQFVVSDDWPCAVQRSILQSFADDLVKDYRATIMRFLSIQTLGSEQARVAVRELRDKVFINGEPHIDSLTKGLDILQQCDLREQAEQVRCPTLVVVGEKDTLVPACSGDYTRQLITESIAKTIPGAGHAPFISHTTSFISVLNEFIRPKVTCE